MNADLIAARAALKPSHLDTIRFVVERPGRAVSTIGADYAEALRAAGYITIRGDKCYPTPDAAPFTGRSPAKLRADMARERVYLLGKWGAMA